MREIEEKIDAWRAEMSSASMDGETVRELESHLREAIDAGVGFDAAVAGLGDVGQLGDEFAKVYPEVSWARRVFWMAAGYGAFALAMAVGNVLAVGVEAWVARLFGGWEIGMPFLIEIAHDPQHIAYNQIPPQGFNSNTIPGAIICKAVFSLFWTIGIIVAIVRFIRGGSLRRVFATPRFLAVFAMGSCGLALLLSQFTVLSLLLHFAKFTLPEFAYGGGYDPDLFFPFQGSYFPLQWWVERPLAVISQAALIATAFWAVWRLGRGGTSDFRVWALGGCLGLGAVGFAAQFASACVVGVFATFYPELAVAQFSGGIFAWGYSYGLRIATWLTLGLVIAFVLLAISVMRRRNRSRLADKLSRRVARFSYLWLVIWAAIVLQQAGGFLPSSESLQLLGSLLPILTFSLSAALACALVVAAIIIDKFGGLSRGLGSDQEARGT